MTSADVDAGQGRTDTHAMDARADDLFTIRVLGELLDDLEHQRIQNGNRISAMEREMGTVLPHLHVIQDELKRIEHEVELELVRAWRKHPLAPWQRSVQGLGEKSFARLIACIGDPADRPNVAKLWQYCGHGNPHLKRRKGMGQEAALKLGSPRAKKQVWLIANNCMKNRNSPYRSVYDDRRLHTLGRDWTDGHKHADALRVTGKAVLRDLWLSARAPCEALPVDDSPARAIVPAKPTVLPPARAVVA